MSLDDAADCIFEGEESLFKSKSRRLYDVANVLRSLGVIKKQKDDKNKNVFMWVGSKGFSLDFKCASIGTKKPFTQPKMRLNDYHEERKEGERKLPLLEGFKVSFNTQS